MACPSPHHGENDVPTTQGNDTDTETIVGLVYNSEDQHEITTSNLQEDQVQQQGEEATPCPPPTATGDMPGPDPDPAEAIYSEDQDGEEAAVEVIETSYMCGECFLLFPTTEDFDAHHCQETKVTKGEEVETIAVAAGENQHPSISATEELQPTECVEIGVWEDGESEAAMEKAVANILGEGMRRTASQAQSAPQIKPEVKVDLGMKCEVIEEEHEMTVSDNNAEDSDGSEHTEGTTSLEIVDIPTTNMYMYDNPAYLNRLMKDNTFGRRVRHDAPYSQRLGPWDDMSSRLLIKLLGEYPRAFFIMDKECKRTEAWEMIRMKLVEADYQFTVLQIRMRWREICKTYRSTVNQNDMCNTRKTCQYFDELNDLFGVWDHPATLTLIQQLENGNKPLGQNGGIRMRMKVWEQISKVLASHGYNFTPDQVQGRWSSLVTLYQRMVEHNVRPQTEPITIAFKEHIERIFNYAPERNTKWLKIVEKRGKTPKATTKQWTLALERSLLSYYHERVYLFNNDHVGNSVLWKEIVQKLEEKDDYSTTVEKVRVRFYEMCKQFSLAEQHNSQPGTLRRECKHHAQLLEIYSVFNFWPHDKSTIKFEKTNTIRMRQVNAQLMWSEEQSRILLTIYPEVLVSYLSSGDQQPREELWLQLAKAYMHASNDKKQCYEIEEHLAVLRRGYHSHNPFPFSTEMQLVEQTEATLRYTSDAPADADTQLVTYWSHTAALLLLDLVIYHRQEGVKNSVLFEVISKRLADFGYRYTGEECRMYYSLLRQLYSNRLRSLKRNREMSKPFPYMEKMAEVDAVVAQPKFSETPETRMIVLNAACLHLKKLKGEDPAQQIENIPSWLMELKMFLKCHELILPPPNIKCLAQIISDALDDSSLGEEFDELYATFSPNADFLRVISGEPSSGAHKVRNTISRNVPQPKYGNVEWTEENVVAMLRVLRQWKMCCHNEAEMEEVLNVAQPVWREVSAKLTDQYKVDPNKCYERFAQLRREYKSVMTFNARLDRGEVTKTVICEEMLKRILSLHTCHDARFDSRDSWWSGNDINNWTQEEILELIFTVRDVWSTLPQVDWALVSKFMAGSGYEQSPVNCRDKFQHLYKNYQTAATYNKSCGVKTRRQPQFYYKLRDLFGSDVHTPEVRELPGIPNSIMELDLETVLPVFVSKLRTLKRHHCHCVPRRPLLMLLANHLNESFQSSTLRFDSSNVWALMVYLHHMHFKAAERNTEILFEINLMETWQHDHNPQVAYGLTAMPIPGWEKVSFWTFEEVAILIEAIVQWQLQQISLEQNGKPFALTASELLAENCYTKTTEECEEQWKYIVSAFRRGGYSQFTEQINLIFLLAPSLLSLRPKARQRMSQQKQQICPESNSIKVVDEASGIEVVKDFNLGEMKSYVEIDISKCTNEDLLHVQITDKKRRCYNTTKKLKPKKEKTKRKRSTSPNGNVGPKRRKKPTSPNGNAGPKKRRSRANDDQQRKRSKAEGGKSQGSGKDPEADPLSLEMDNSLPHTEASQNKVRVEVVSITETKTGKLIECQTESGMKANQRFHVHYPADHPLPPVLKHLYIPQDILNSDTASSSDNGKCSQPSVGDVNSDVISIPSSLVSLSDGVCEFVVKDEIIEEPSALGSDVYTNLDRATILQLVNEYSQQQQQDYAKLSRVIRETNRQHISLLKEIVSVFRELRNELDV